MIPRPLAPSQIVFKRGAPRLRVLVQAQPRERVFQLVASLGFTGGGRGAQHQVPHGFRKIPAAAAGRRLLAPLDAVALGRHAVTKERVRRAPAEAKKKHARDLFTGTTYAVGSNAMEAVFRHRVIPLLDDASLVAAAAGLTVLFNDIFLQAYQAQLNPPASP